MNKIYVLGSFCLLFLFLSLCACSTGPSFPYGTFVGPADFYHVVLKKDGSFTFLDNKTVTSEGTFSIHGNELTWETDSHCAAVDAQKATYTWTFDNDNLELDVKGNDKCTDRLDVYRFPYHLQQ